MRKRLTGLMVLVIFAGLGMSFASEEGEPKALFLAKCAKCHGQDGVPKKIAKGAPNFNDPKWRDSITLEQLITGITKGKGKVMPPFADKLSTEQIRSIAEWVRSFGNGNSTNSQGGKPSQESTSGN